MSEYICRDFIANRAFIEQKVVRLEDKNFPRDPLYQYLAQLHAYLEFLINNSMIHATKRHKVFNPTTEEFVSDRSTKEMKALKDPRLGNSKKKESSERKGQNVTGLKRVNTSQALKKGVSMKSKK